jgi:hypothetical protein
VKTMKSLGLKYPSVGPEALAELKEMKKVLESDA